MSIRGRRDAHGMGNWWVPAVVMLLMAVTVAEKGAAQDFSREAGGGTPEELVTAADVVHRVLQADPVVQGSALQVLQARERYGLALAGTRPSLDLEVRPYTRDQRRVPGGVAGPVNTVTQSVGGGVQLTQPLPTSGVVSAGVDLDIQQIGGDAPAEWRQVPSVSFAWNQPLLGGGEIIGNRVFLARLRTTEIGLEVARLQDTATRNRVVVEALQLLVQVQNLRGSRDLLERTIRLLERQLESAELDRQQGLISDTALLALQVTLNGRRDLLFTTELQLVRAEQLLARSLGRDSLAEVALSPELPELMGSGSGFGSDWRPTLNENPMLAMGDLAVEQAERAAVVNTAVDQPVVTLFARAQPVYPAERASRDDFGRSVSDLFADGSLVESTLGITLTVPLLARRQRDHRGRIDDLARQNAVLERSDTEQVLFNQLQTVLLNRQFLEQRRELILVDTAFEEQRVTNERTLVDAGVSTPLRLEEVELDLMSRRQEAQRISGELFLNALEILSLAGEDLAAAVRR